MSKITKEWTIGEVINENEDLTETLMGFGMHCFHCPMSQMETLEEAAGVHGVDADLLVEKVNEFLNK